LDNDYKKPQQEVPHHLIGLSLLHTPITPLVAISTNQSTIGGGGKAALKWKRKRQQPIPTTFEKKPKLPLYMKLKCNGPNK
jgi:hypothetical protein